MLKNVVLICSCNRVFIEKITIIYIKTQYLHLHSVLNLVEFWSPHYWSAVSHTANE